MTRLMLSVRCGACGREFDTGIRIDRRNFDRGTFASNYHICPRCGGRGTYRKQDYLTAEEDRRPGRNPAALE